MDEAEIIKNQNILNKIIDQINTEILSTNNKINMQIENIKIQNDQLIQVTSQVVILTGNIETIQNEINDNQKDIAKLNIEKDELAAEIKELEQESQRLRQHIEKEITPSTVIMDLLNNLVTPGSGFLKSLVNDFRACLIKMEQYANEINKKVDLSNQINQKIEQLETKRGQLQSDVDKLNQLSNECDKKIHQLGEDKTNTENFKLQLEKFRSRAQLILNNCIVGKDLLEFGDNPINDILIQLQNCYSQNGLQLVF